MKDEGLDIPPPQHQGRTNSFVEIDGLEHKKNYLPLLKSA